MRQVEAFGGELVDEMFREVDEDLVLAIDPGSDESGMVVWNGERVLLREIHPNDQVVAELDTLAKAGAACVVEYTPPYVLRTADGRPYVPSQVFTTAKFVGRIEQRWLDLAGEAPVYVPRRDVLKHVTGKGARVGDKEVRAALIAKFGGKDQAIGRKDSPGPLYGIKSHMWPALGLAITYHETHVAPTPAF